MAAGQYSIDSAPTIYYTDSLPQIFFFLSRYCIILAFIGLIISFTVTTKINCAALYTFNSWTGNMSILCASTSLMLRTIALWERSKKVIVPLAILCLGHWAFLYRGMFLVSASWDPTANACIVDATNPSLLTITFFYTMGFDLIILLFTMFALMGKHSARTDLWKLLFTDGLVYFVVTFTTNSLPAILNVLNLNTMMNVIATVPAAAVSSIAACRAVIRLQEFASAEVYVHSTSQMSGGNNVVIAARRSMAAAKAKHGVARPEIRVTTEHITMEEFSSRPTEVASPYSKTERRTSSSSDDLESVGMPYVQFAKPVRNEEKDISDYV
ncbi:hypothetical protein PTI98_004816 [Pleurotus ostreatus]|nr:hypothetical protein PTI98_004816 [Pleurotus ostreatus]